MADRKTEANGDRDARGRFLPGNKGGGRPAVSKAFKEKCREFMNEEGWPILAEMARKKGKEQLPALTLIANYAYGKPTQYYGSDEDNPLKVIVDLI